MAQLPSSFVFCGANNSEKCSKCSNSQIYLCLKDYENLVKKPSTFVFCCSNKEEKCSNCNLYLYGREYDNLILNLSVVMVFKFVSGRVKQDILDIFTEASLKLNFLSQNVIINCKPDERSRDLLKKIFECRLVVEYKIARYSDFETFKRLFAVILQYELPFLQRITPGMKESVNIFEFYIAMTNTYLRIINMIKCFILNKYDDISCLIFLLEINCRVGQRITIMLTPSEFVFHCKNIFSFTNFIVDWHKKDHNEENYTFLLVMHYVRRRVDNLIHFIFMSESNLLRKYLEHLKMERIKVEKYFDQTDKSLFKEYLKNLINKMK